MENITSEQITEIMNAVKQIAVKIEEVNKNGFAI